MEEYGRMMNDSVINYLRCIGRRGGQSKSQKKIDAGRRNIAKATKARLERKEKNNLTSGL